MVRRLESRERAMGEIAELAQTFDETREFRAELLDRLDRWIGFDLATMHSVRGAEDASMYVRGYDAALVEERILGYLMELEPHELAAVEADRPMIDIEVLPLARREQLSLYREQLWPQRVSVFTTVVWRNRHGAFGFHLARSGRGRRFSRQERETLEVLLPSIKLAEAYLRTRTEAAPAVARSFDAWADEVRLTRSERAVAELVARGLQNREIAALLGISPLTARNHLATVFRKADVTTRAELAFVCSNAGEERRVNPGNAPAWSALLERLPVRGRQPGRTPPA
ncbi:MAG: LuxR C-terminal-related transcriptional regulator [Myxococcaceae bacterium]